MDALAAEARNQQVEDPQDPARGFEGHVQLAPAGDPRVDAAAACRTHTRACAGAWAGACMSNPGRKRYTRRKRYTA